MDKGLDVPQEPKVELNTLIKRYIEVKTEIASTPSAVPNVYIRDITSYFKKIESFLKKHNTEVGFESELGSLVDFLLDYDEATMIRSLLAIRSTSMLWFRNSGETSKFEAVQAELIECKKRVATRNDFENLEMMIEGIINNVDNNFTGALEHFFSERIKVDIYDAVLDIINPRDKDRLVKKRYDKSFRLAKNFFYLVKEEILNQEKINIEQKAFYTRIDANNLFDNLSPDKKVMVWRWLIKYKQIEESTDNDWDESTFPEYDPEYHSLREKEMEEVNKTVEKISSSTSVKGEDILSEVASLERKLGYYSLLIKEEKVKILDLVVRMLPVEVKDALLLGYINNKNK